MLKQEWFSIWKDKKLFLSIIVMFLMPLLYCGLLLYAFWDPYGQLEKLPVAIVNEDKGAVLDDENKRLGDELVNNLRENATFKFIETSRDEAENMLQDGEVYITIALPENFSAHATTMLDADPEKLEIEYKVNEAVNYLSSKIGESAINSIRSEVNEEVVKTYAEQLFTSITKLGDGFGEAADGAAELQNGVTDLKAGSQELQDYLIQLATSTVSLKDGTHTLAEGVTAAKIGAEKLVEGSGQLGSGSEQLASGALELQHGVNSITTGITNYTNGVSEVASGQQQLLDGQKQFQSKLDEVAVATANLSNGASSVSSGAAQLSTGLTDINKKLEQILASLPSEQRTALQASLNQLEQSSKQIAAGADSVAQGATQLSSGTQQLNEAHATIVTNSEKLAAGMNTLTSNSSQLQAGTTQLESGFTTLAEKLTEFNTGINSVVGGISSLYDGLNQLDSGSQELATGTQTLSEKSSELADGSRSLVEGTGKLADGADELVTALKDAHNEATIDVSDQNYDMVAAPVEVNKDVQNKVANYGTGLAPYFITLGLFVGALLITNVYNYVQPAIQPTGVVRWFASKFSVLFVIWIFQTAILTLVLLYGLKLNVTNVPLFILLMAVISFAFITIVQLIFVLFGDVGKLIALIFLIVQLSSSAGTFPVELLPDVFQKLYQFMPMSYAIEALRHIISSTNYSVIYKDIIILATAGIACFVLSFIYFVIVYRRRYSKQVVETA